MFVLRLADESVLELNSIDSFVIVVTDPIYETDVIIQRENGLL